MSIKTMVSRKIKAYQPKGGLDHTARLIIALCDVNHQDVRCHIERVSLLCEATAKVLKKDPKAAFFGGLLHDVGKIVLPFGLFDGHNISAEEYALVKTHALAGFKSLRKLHYFVALCAGLHHALYKAGYGLTVADFPRWNPGTIKKMLEISAIISICDFVDAFTHRQTQIKDGSNQAGPSLLEMLQQKYPDDHVVIEVVLREHVRLAL